MRGFKEICGSKRWDGDEKWFQTATEVHCEEGISLQYQESERFVLVF